MKILIIEDEETIARRIIRMTRSYFKDQILELTAVDEIDEGIQILNNQEIDLLLLDLNLNGEDGFEVLKKFMSEAFHTIIISAYKDRAITAFEYGVLDFVPKPFDEVRLFQAFNRFLSSSGQTNEVLKYLSILKNGKRSLINVEDILFIKGARVYTELHLKNGKTEVHNKSLERLSQLLPNHFERIHKSYLVDIRQIKDIEKKRLME